MSSSDDLKKRVSAALSKLEKSGRVGAFGKSEKVTIAKSDFQSEDLLKMGAMARLYPVSRVPNKPKGVGEWLQGGGERESVPREADSNRRARFLNRLASETQVRVHDDGKRSFLLYRGTDPEEGNVHRGIITHDQSTSWTPHHHVAWSHAADNASEKETNHVVHSAWVHEDKIRNIPFHYGNLDEEGSRQGPNHWKHEHEVVVEPYHESDHEDTDTVSPGALKEGYRPRAETLREKITNAGMNRRINARTKVKKSSALISRVKDVLAKGKNGDWEKEGYTLHYFDDSDKALKFVQDKDIDTRSLQFGHHSVYALSPNGGMIGHATFDYKENGGGLKPLDTHIDRLHRNKGLASAIYSLVESRTGEKIVPSDKQSPDAKALWSQPNRPFGKSAEEVSIPKDEFIDEHKRLIDVLESPSHEDDKKEAKKQKKELKEELRKESNKSSFEKSEALISRVKEALEKSKSHDAERLSKAGSSIKKPGHPDHAETGRYWETYLKSRKFSSEKEAHDFVQSSVERGNRANGSFFKPTDFATEVKPHLRAVKSGKSFKIKSAYGSPRPAFNSFNYENHKPGSDASLPNVSFNVRDVDGAAGIEEAAKLYGPHKPGARAYQAYVPVTHVPESKMPDRKKGYDSNYDWESFNYRHAEGFPPAKIKIHSSGKVSILDGNHRIHHWKEQGHTHIPAIVIDERNPSKIDPEDVEKSSALISRVKDVLEKGAMKRLAPFNPEGVLDDHDKQTLATWQGAPSDSRPIAREALPKMDGAARFRALHKLAGQTKTRLGPDGKRQFLLHRGMSQDEFNATSNTTHIGHKEQRSSWTPREDLANNFANPYVKTPGKLVSAWIHEDDIHTIPKQYGSVDAEYEASSGSRRNRMAIEHEVIVRRGHHSEINSASDAQKPKTYAQGRITDEPRDLNDAINMRGEQEKKDRRIFGKSESVIDRTRALVEELKKGKNGDWKGDLDQLPVHISNRQLGHHFSEGGCWGMAHAIHDHLKRRGLNPVIKVSKSPFVHAWVEVDGHSIDDEGVRAAKDYPLSGVGHTVDSLRSEAYRHGVKFYDYEGDRAAAEEIIRDASNHTLGKSEFLTKDDGINGDWKDDKLSFRVKDGTKKLGHRIFIYQGKKRVGHIAYSKYADQEGYHSVFNSNLDESHRGKGLYQEIIRRGIEHVRSLGGKGLKSEGFQRSLDADRAWQKVNPEVRPSRQTLLHNTHRGNDYFVDERHLKGHQE